ncbi:MAG: hypothetical protein K0U39_05590 [Alphaproteobacteria bacterium]|nr:hypothetical protein [Alphaproteobacteria bacterium]
MTFRPYRHIFYKILYYFANNVLLIAILFTTTACRIHLDMPANNKQITTAYTITRNDISIIDFDNAHKLTASLETIFGWSVGTDNIPQNLRDDLRTPTSRFFAPAVIDDYRKQQSKPDFDIFTFRQKLLFALAKQHGINFRVVTRQLQ